MDPEKEQKIDRMEELSDEMSQAIKAKFNELMDKEENPGLVGAAVIRAYTIHLATAIGAFYRSDKIPEIQARIVEQLTKYTNEIQERKSGH